MERKINQKIQILLSICIIGIMLLSTAPALAIDTLATPTGLRWENGFCISWDAVPYAQSYDVRVYNSGRLSAYEKTTENTLDLTHNIGYGGAYTFRVTAIGDGTNYSNSTRSASSEAKTVRGDTTTLYDIYVDAKNGEDVGAGTKDDPFATIERARALIGMYRSSAAKDINVHLRGTFYYGENPRYGYTKSRTNNILNTAGKAVDTYEVKSALTFTDADNLANGKMLTFRNWEKDTATISGGKRISGWELHDGEKNIWKIYVGDEERARNARQLYINGTRAIRARSHTIPEGALFSQNVQYVGAEVGMQNWAHVEDVEFVYYRKWCSYHVGVESVTENDGNYIVNMVPYAWEFATKTNSSKTEITETSDLEYIENAYELLDTPGEYYINRHTGEAFYMPRQGEDITSAVTVVPMVDSLVLAEGTSTASRVMNLTFDGITFTDTTWLRPNGAMGHLSNQSDASRHEGKFFEGTIHAQTVDNVHIKNCIVKNTGNIGICYIKQVQNCNLVGNVVRDTTGPGIVMVDPAKGYGSNAEVAKDAGNRNDNIQISNNYIYNVGLEFPSSTGLVGGRLSNTKILHNEIAECPYSGISMGWHSGADQVEVGNVVAYNIVRDVMTSGIDDGGNFYHLGPTAGNEETPGWLIKENYLTGIYGSVSPMYSDNSSSWLKYVRNVVSTKYSIDDTRIRTGYTQGGTKIAKNILYQDNFYTNGGFYDAADRIWIYGDRKTTYNTYSGNEKYPADAWPEEALAIIEKAGLEPAYRYIKTDKNNLITDGSFEHVKTAYARPWKAGKTTLERNSAAFTEGAYSGKVTLETLGGDISQTLRIDTSKSYRFSIKIKAEKPDTVATVTAVKDGKSKILIQKPVSDQEFTLCSTDIAPTSEEASRELIGIVISVSDNNRAGDVFYVDECMLYETETDNAQLFVSGGMALAEYQRASRDGKLLMAVAVYDQNGAVKHVLWEEKSVSQGATQTWSKPIPKTSSGDVVKLFFWDAESFSPVIKEQTIIVP